MQTQILQHEIFAPKRIETVLDVELLHCRSDSRTVMLEPAILREARRCTCVGACIYSWTG